MIWILGIISVAGIGVGIGTLTSRIIGKRVSRIAGAGIVFSLCMAYHAIAALSLSKNILVLSPLVITIIVPFGFGFGFGDHVFYLALLIQAIIAGAIGVTAYWRRENIREQAGAGFPSQGAGSPDP